MNNKGFTLVELLAVMVILLAISVVAVTNVTASLKRNENQEIATQKKIAINAAKIYFSMNNTTSVSVDDLIDGNYLECSDIDKLDNCFDIKFGETAYIFEKKNSCDSCKNTLPIATS